MILAAGCGKRMRPLTYTTPKPLLLVKGKPIIQYTIERLVAEGFTEIVINIAHLGQHIKQVLGDGSSYGASIAYSNEKDNALETGGGIIKALPLLGKHPFLLVNGDIVSNYAFSKLNNISLDLAHLLLIPNPKHNTAGDFHLSANGFLGLNQEPKLTYSGIGLYSPDLFHNIALGKIKLKPILEQAMTNNRVTGEQFNGFWMDIGTVQSLLDLDEHYNKFNP